MHLGRRETVSADVFQRLPHVVGQLGNFRRGGVFHRLGHPFQHLVAHPGDLQDGHDFLLFLPASFLRYTGVGQSASPRGG